MIAPAVKRPLSDEALGDGTMAGPDEPAASPSIREARAESLALAVVLALGMTSLTRWAPFVWAWTEDVAGLKSISWMTYRHVVLLGLGLLLTLPTCRRSGLRLGEIRGNWRRVLLVCGLPPLAAALVFPFLPVRPYAEASATMWLVSPLAQSLIFAGYLYGRLEPLYPAPVHPRLPVRTALVITAAAFAFAHVPNFLYLPAAYVLFQLFYTSVLYLVPALSRQWTGSVFYVALCHSAVNFVAWYAS